jgi:hypothetical protein
MAESSSATRTGQIVDITNICRSYPQLADPQIGRDNVIQLLDTMLDSDLQLLTIEGAEGIGKTTLLAQFAKHHGDKCFSVFVRPTSKFAYDPTVIRQDMCDQMNWFLTATELDPHTVIDESVYRQLLMDLQRRARQFHQRFYFVVDGVTDIPQDGPQVQDILGMLPFGLPQFKFLISGTAESLLGSLKNKINHKPVLVIPFTLDETVRFLSNLNLSPSEAHEFHRAAKGTPSHLAAIRRLLESGSSPESLLGHLPGKLPTLFEMEWKAVDTSNDLQLDALALLSYDRRKHTLVTIARTFNTTPELTASLLSPLTFVTMSPGEQTEVQFVSESFRNFVGSRLQARRERVRSCVIDTLMMHPESDEALAFLPTYLDEAGKLEELIEFLSPDHFAAMVEKSRSLSPVQQKAELGLTAALKQNRDGDMLRFGLERVVLAELRTTEIPRSEIEARMALGEYDKAVALAQSSILTQNRLRLLAAIARLQKRDGLTPEAAVVEQISQLFAETEDSALMEGWEDLASDLMFSRPD